MLNPILMHTPTHPKNAAVRCKRTFTNEQEMEMQKTSTADLVRMADDIRALTLQVNAIADLQKQSARIVWACHETIKAYEGHRNADTTYVAQVVSMEIAANRKVAQCDKWLAEWSPKLQTMVEVYSNQE